MRDLCDTALGAYDAEQTNRSSSGYGERGASFGDSIILKNTPTAIISTGDYRAQCAVLGAWAVAHVRVRYPVIGVGRLSGSLLGCLRKDVALV
ncbi:MAG TPA: hypothetical protein VIM51_08365 [Desulfosporosinus sp.]